MAGISPMMLVQVAVPPESEECVVFRLLLLRGERAVVWLSAFSIRVGRFIQYLRLCFCLSWLEV